MLTGGLVACGTVKELSAAQKVSAAFTKLGESKDLGIKLSLDVTPDQLTAYGKATGEKMDPQAAEALAGLSVSVALHADKPLKDLKGLDGPAGAADPQADAELKRVQADYLIADRSGAVLLEVRLVNGVAYLHGDLTAVAKLTGEDADQLRQGLDRAGDRLGPIKDALDGGWVQLDSKALEGLGGKPGTDGAGAPGALPSVDPGAQQDVLNSLKNMISGDLDFESLGKKDGADEIRASLSVRKLAQDVLKAFKPLADKLPKEALGHAFPTDVPPDVPDKTVSAELSIRNGLLSSASFDLTQLDEKAPPASYLPLRLSFDQSPPAVQAPPKATELTEQDLEKAFAAMADAGRPGGDGPGGNGSAGPGGLPGTPAPTLTDAQVQELVRKTGEPADSIRAMNRLGFGYDEILAMGQGDGGQA